jgi:hypothetical protein
MVLVMMVVVVVVVGWTQGMRSWRNVPSDWLTPKVHTKEVTSCKTRSVSGCAKVSLTNMSPDVDLSLLQNDASRGNCTRIVGVTRYTMFGNSFSGFRRTHTLERVLGWKGSSVR